MSAKTRTAQIDIATSDTISEVIDFGEAVQLAWIHIEALEATTTLDIQVAPSLDENAPDAGDYITVLADVAGGVVTEDIYLLDDADNAIGPFRYFRLEASVAQTANRDFKVAGLCYY